MPENRAWTFFLHMEEVHDLGKLAVIALFSFFKSVEIGLEVFLARPGGTVNPLQHGIAAIAPPIGTGDLHQFEGLANMLGRWQVRTTTQIVPTTMIVKFYFLCFRKI